MVRSATLRCALVVYCFLSPSFPPSGALWPAGVVKVLLSICIPIISILWLLDSAVLSGYITMSLLLSKCIKKRERESFISRGEPHLLVFKKVVTWGRNLDCQRDKISSNLIMRTIKSDGKGRRDG